MPGCHVQTGNYLLLLKSHTSTYLIVDPVSLAMEGAIMCGDKDVKNLVDLEAINVASGPTLVYL